MGLIQFVIGLNANRSTSGGDVEEVIEMLWADGSPLLWDDTNPILWDNTVWILEEAIWNDDGQWDDNNIWIDLAA